MFKKIKKVPSYFRSINKRIISIGFFKTVNELIKYNRFYYLLLKKNEIKVGIKTVLFHTAFYTKVVNLFSEISHEELMKITIPIRACKITAVKDNELASDCVGGACPIR